MLPTKIRPGANLQVQSGIADVGALRQSLPLELPWVLYEALAGAILAILILIYQQRPRGWSNRDLVQARPHMWLLLFDMMQGYRVYCYTFR